MKKEIRKTIEENNAIKGWFFWNDKTDKPLVRLKKEKIQ